MGIWQLVLIQVVTFVLIILFLRWLLHGQISRALNRLQQLNQQTMAKEKALKDELERAKVQTEGEIARAKAEAENIKEKTKEDAEKESSRILEISRREAKRIVNEGIRDSQRKYNDLLLEMQDKSAYLAIDIIKYIFSEHSQKTLQSQLIDELINEMDGLEKEKLDSVKDGNVVVISAFPLEARQKTKLTEVLSAKFRKNIALTEEIQPETIAGVVVKLGGYVIDGSIKNKFKKILPLLKEKAKAVD